MKKNLLGNTSVDLENETIRGLRPSIDNITNFHRNACTAGAVVNRSLDFEINTTWSVGFPRQFRDMADHQNFRHSNGKSKNLPC